MNIIRTIQQDEMQEWVDLLFDVGPHDAIPGVEDAPAYPPRFPFPYRFGKDIEGGYIYLLYCGRIRGYAKIDEVTPHRGTAVGTQEQDVDPGDMVICDGPFLPMPFLLKKRGFQNFRYVGGDLHLLDHDVAQGIVDDLG